MLDSAGLKGEFAVVGIEQVVVKRKKVVVATSPNSHCWDKLCFPDLRSNYTAPQGHREVRNFVRLVE